MRSQWQIIASAFRQNGAFDLTSVTEFRRFLIQALCRYHPLGSA